MLWQLKPHKRRGSVLPLVAFMTVALMGLLALAIDLGTVAVARNQCQNAADTSAMAGARTITGDASGGYNVSSVPKNAITAAINNQVFGKPIQGDPNVPYDPATSSYITGQVEIDVGTYAYTYNDANPGAEGFGIQFPRTDVNEPYSAVRSTITFTGNFAFGRIFGLNTFNAKAQSTAAHRPRDVMVIMDLSGSMRFQSLPGVPLTSSSQAAPGSTTNGPREVSMNPESIFPQFGHYSNVALAALQGTKSIATSGQEYVDPNNFSSDQAPGPCLLNDFYQNPVGTPPPRRPTP